VRGDVAVGVALEAVVLLGPGQSGQPHGDPGRQLVDVDADPDPGELTDGVVPGSVIAP
jgi:hypothetical protein